MFSKASSTLAAASTRSDRYSDLSSADMAYTSRPLRFPLKPLSTIVMFDPVVLSITELIDGIVVEKRDFGAHFSSWPYLIIIPDKYFCKSYGYPAVSKDEFRFIQSLYRPSFRRLRKGKHSNHSTIDQESLMESETEPLPDGKV